MWMGMLWGGLNHERDAAAAGAATVWPWSMSALLSRRSRHWVSTAERKLSGCVWKRRAGPRTAQDLLLPNAHLVVHQAVLLHLVAQLDQALGHVVHHVGAEETGVWRLVADLQQVGCHVLLFLANRQPADVEVIPELQPVGVQQLIVPQDAYSTSNISNGQPWQVLVNGASTDDASLHGGGCMRTGK